MITRDAARSAAPDGLLRGGSVVVGTAGYVDVGSALSALAGALAGSTAQRTTARVIGRFVRGDGRDAVVVVAVARVCLSHGLTSTRGRVAAIHRPALQAHGGHRAGKGAIGAPGGVPLAVDEPGIELGRTGEQSPVAVAHRRDVRINGVR